MEKQIKELQEQLGAAQLREASLKAAIDERDERITELEEQLKNAIPGAAEQPTVIEIPTETFTVDGEEWQFIVATFYADGKRHLASEVLKDADKLKILVEKKSGVIAKVK